MRAVTEPVGGSSSNEINKMEETEQLESIDLQEGANEETDFHYEQEHYQKSLDHINKTACEVEIPESMDDQLPEDMPSPYTGADVETT